MKGKRFGFLMICNKLYSIRNISVSLLKKILEKRILQTVISNKWTQWKNPFLKGVREICPQAGGTKKLSPFCEGSYSPLLQARPVGLRGRAYILWRFEPQVGKTTNCLPLKKGAILLAPLYKLSTLITLTQFHRTTGK
jgi:hypothetical protein